MNALNRTAMAAFILSVVAISFSLHAMHSVPQGTDSHKVATEIRGLRDDIAALRQTVPKENEGSPDEIKLLRGEIAAVRESVARNVDAKKVDSPSQIAAVSKNRERQVEIGLTPATWKGGFMGGWTLPKQTEQVQRVAIKTNTSTSRRESLGFFDYSDEDWARKKRIAKEQDQHQVAKGVNNLDGRTFYQNNWEPNWSCGYEKRIGKTGDGGKWICDPFRITNKPAEEECIILSVGSENDFSFETEVHKINPRCIIHTFDHTIIPRNVPPFVNFHPWGLGKQDTGKIKTFAWILKELGLWDKPIDLLKIDCEGCEFTVLDQFFWNEGFFRQILIELHFNKAWSVSRSMQNTIQSNHDIFLAFRNNGYVITHKEPNIQHAGGDCTEFSFLKLNLAGR